MLFHVTNAFPQPTTIREWLKHVMSKHNISLVACLFISTLFTVKYASRYTGPYAGVAMALLIAAIQVFFWRNKYALWQNNGISRFTPGQHLFIDTSLFVMLILASLVAFRFVPAETLNVDRWEVIQLFWNAYFDGHYAYDTKSGMGNTPGPMPFYFLLALPFYLSGELGFLSIAGLLTFYMVIRRVKTPPLLTTTMILLVIASPPVLWEVITRSNIFFNASLILLSMVYFFGVSDHNAIKNRLVTGVLCGLLLSTRNVFVMCYAIMFFYAVKQRLMTMPSMMVTATVALATFAASFLPFVAGHFSDFLQVNPFVVQSTVLIPLSWSLTIVAASLFLFLLCKDQLDVFFYSGMALFLTIILHVVYQSLRSNLHAAIFDSRADISYFLLGAPFLLYYALQTSRQP